MRYYDLVEAESKLAAALVMLSELPRIDGNVDVQIRRAEYDLRDARAQILKLKLAANERGRTFSLRASEGGENE